MYKIALITCLALSVSFVSCKSTSNNNIVDNRANNFLTANVKDSLFDAHGALVSGEKFDSGSTHTLSIVGHANDLDTIAFQDITISISHYIVGTTKYGVGTNSSTQATITYWTSSGLQMAKYGTLNLTKVGANSAAGNFTCTLPDSTKITNGQFDLIW